MLRTWCLGLLCLLLAMHHGFGQTDPRVPQQLSPPDGATREPVATTLRWRAVSDSALYCLQVARDSVFTDLLIADSSRADTAARVSLPYDTELFWRVGLQGDTIRFSPAWSFTTVPLPPRTAALLAPIDSAQREPLRPTLHWYRVPNAGSYLVQVAADSDFATLVFADSSAKGPFRKVDGRLANLTQYFWRVAALMKGKQGPFSQVWRFSTTAPPVFTIPSAEFGLVARREQSHRHIVLANPVAGPMGIDSVLLSRGAFTHVGALPDSVQAGDSLSLELRFRPHAFGAFADTLHVFTDQGEAQMVLRGASPPPVMEVTTHGLTFGPVAVTDTARGSVIVRNRGLVNTLSVERLGLSNPVFFRQHVRGVTIPPGDSAAVEVRFLVNRFRKDAFGIQYDTLMLHSDGGRAAVPLVGLSPPPEIRVTPERIVTEDVALLDSLIFAVMVTDSSVNTLRIDTIATRLHAFRPKFSRARVGPHDTLWVPVRFLPQQYGPFEDTLRLISNASTHMVKVPLLGFCPYPEAGFDLARLDFRAIKRGGSASQILTVSNSSISFLRVDSVKTRSRAFKIDKVSGSIVRIGSPLRLTVTLAPDSIRQFADTLYVFTSGPDSPLKVPLEGAGVEREEDVGRDIPGEYALFQNYPNPFTGSTTIKYALPERTYARLEIFDVLGGRVALLADGEHEAGFHEVRWQPDVTSGMYFYRLEAGNFRAIKKLMILK